MAWSFDFGDTFSTYNMARVTSEGHWTSLTGIANAVTIAEDGLQGIAPQFLVKNLLTTTFGRMLVARIRPTAPQNGASGLLAILGSDGTLKFSINYNEVSGVITLHLPNGSSITSADPNAVLPNLQMVNLGLTGLLDGVNMYYAVRVNNVVIGDLTGQAAFATTIPLSMISPSRGFGSGVCFSQYAWMLSKTYSGTGGMPVNADWFGNLKRGVLRGDEDGQYPAVQVGARWIPNSGTKYFSRLNETLSDGDTTRATNIVDPGGVPTAVDRMSIQLEDPPVTLVNIGAVQRRAVMKMQTGSGTARLFYGLTGSAGDTYDLTNVAVASSYNAELRPLILDPRDNAAWNRAKLVNLDLGLECFDLA